MLLCCGLAGVLWDLRWKRFFVPPGGRQTPWAIRVGSGEALRPLQRPRQCRLRWPHWWPAHSEAHGELDSERMVASRGWRCRSGDGEPEGCSHHRQENFGAIIERQTTTFFDEALKEDMFRDPDAVRVLIPPTTYARKCIQRMVDTVKPSNLDSKERLFFWSNLSSLWAPVILQFVSQSSGAFIGYANHFFSILLGWTCWTQGITTQQAGAVWVRQLKEDRSDRCQSVAPPRKHYCIGFYDLNNHVYANSAANYMDWWC